MPNNPFNKTIFASLTYVIVSILATLIGVRENLIPHVLNITSDKTIKGGLLDKGTAISPPIQMLILVGILIILLLFKWRGRKYTALGLSIIGFLSFLGSIFEHLTLRVFRPISFDLMLALLILMVSISAIAMSYFGFIEFSIERRKFNTPHESIEL